MAHRSLTPQGPPAHHALAARGVVGHVLALVATMMLLAAAGGAGQVTTAAALPVSASVTSDATASALSADMARLGAIGAYTSATQALAAARTAATAAVAAAGRTVAANRGVAAQAAAAETAAEAVQHAAVTAAGQARTNLDVELGRMAELAVALYVHADAPVAGQPPDLADAAASRAIMLGLLLGHERDVIGTERRQVTDTARAVDVAQAGTRRAAATLARADAAVADAQAGEAHARSVADAAVARAAATVSDARRVATGASPAPGAPPGVGPDGPTIMGASLLTADELAGWFATSGSGAATTVPLRVLAGYYISAGQAEGVRGDIAFAQSVIETGHFSFPSGGQLAGADNNFAGIGACDSCSQGWSFPDAQTGVRAQMQLLHAYASTKPVATPLVGSVGVSGCCPTWMSLTGVWATATTYGSAILSLYRQIVDWALPARAAAAGL